MKLQTAFEENIGIRNGASKDDGSVTPIAYHAQYRRDGLLVLKLSTDQRK